MAHDESLLSLLAVYDDLGRQVAAEGTAAGALCAVTVVAARSVPGVDAASITRQRAGSFETVGSTADAATAADAIRYELGNGPCVDASTKDNVFRSGDLATDPRWPTFGALAVETTPVRSVLSIRISVDDDAAMAGLNLYSFRIAAFDERAEDLATLLAVHAGEIVARLVAQEKAANLETALISNREIGAAMGVLISAHKISRKDAFHLLRITSQRTNRKLRDIATEVVDTGTIDLT